MQEYQFTETKNHVSVSTVCAHTRLVRAVTHMQKLYSPHVRTVKGTACYKPHNVTRISETGYSKKNLLVFAPQSLSQKGSIYILIKDKNAFRTMMLQYQINGHKKLSFIALTGKLFNPFSLH